MNPHADVAAGRAGSGRLFMQRDFDAATPNVARVYDVLLGGKDNFEADRESAAKLLPAAPGAAVAAREREFRAYRRLPGARRDTALSAATAAEMAALIAQAEQAGAARPGRSGWGAS
jgi:hypothetical protein